VGLQGRLVDEQFAGIVDEAQDVVTGDSRGLREDGGGTWGSDREERGAEEDHGCHRGGSEHELAGTAAGESAEPSRELRASSIGNGL